jgi:hypothetical protein
MTEPNRYRFCDSCGFEGDVSHFIRKGPDGIAIRSKYIIAHVDQLRYGIEQARENGYYPYEEFCPMCGYNSESNDDATNARCLAKGRLIRIKRSELLQQRRNKEVLQVTLFMIVTALAAWLIILYA